MSQVTLDDLLQIMRTCSGRDEAVSLSEDATETEFLELGYDSLAVLEIVTQVQRQFGLAISDEDIETLTTPASMLEYINGNLTAA
jgi:minimal PKS acyl carrier protein